MISNYVNNALPIVGLMVILYAIICPRFKTVYSDVGAFMHLGFVFWLLLVWADWGPEGFNPVWQTSSARIIVFVMVILVMNMSKNHARVCRTKIKDKQIEIEFNSKCGR